MEKARVARLGQREFLMGFSLHLLEVELNTMFLQNYRQLTKVKGGFFYGKK